jgi:hypothetical protein
VSKHYGKCALCGNECELTFEHIPPRAAFNSTPAKPVTGEGLLDDDRMPWDTTGLPYKNQQQGMGRYTLCQTCNNNTGSWYGEDYRVVARVIHSILSEPMDPKYQAFCIRDIYPLRFIKQVLSMFCSINNFEDDRIDTLRKFVIDKEVVGLDKSKYKICMYLTKSNLMKYAPLSVVLRMGETKCESLALTEITAYPLGFVLYFNPTETFHYDGFDITHFADCEYDDVADIQMPLCIYEMNDLFPTYYRSKEEIKQCVEKNKERSENDE